MTESYLDKATFLTIYNKTRLGLISVTTDVSIPALLNSNVIYSDFQKQISGNKCSRSSFGSELMKPWSHGQARWTDGQFRTFCKG